MWKAEENITCCSGLQLTCVFLDISAAPKANDWGRASTAQQKADSVPQMQVLTSPLVHCNLVLNSLEQKQKFPSCLSWNGPLNTSLQRSPSGAGWACSLFAAKHVQSVVAWSRRLQPGNGSCQGSHFLPVRRQLVAGS